MNDQWKESHGSLLNVIGETKHQGRTKQYYMDPVNGSADHLYDTKYMQMAGDEPVIKTKNNGNVIMNTNETGVSLDSVDFLVSKKISLQGPRKIKNPLAPVK